MRKGTVIGIRKTRESRTFATSRSLLFSWLLVWVTVVSPRADTLPSELHFVENEQGGLDGWWGSAGLDVSPDGLNLYMTCGYGEDAPMLVFSRSAHNGRLNHVESHAMGYSFECAVSPDGDHVYAVGADEGFIAVWSRNNATGRLSLVEKMYDLLGDQSHHPLSCVAVSPDGEHVYAASHRDSLLFVFRRDATSGMLTYEQSLDVGHEASLLWPNSVLVSADGAHVYLAGRDSDSVGVFSRDISTGRVTHLQTVVEGQDGVQGVLGPSELAISPDGAHLYVACLDSSAVAIFSRSSSTGLLTFAAAALNNVAGVEEMSGPSAVRVSPDGVLVVVAAIDSDAVVLFSRDASTGALSFVQAEGSEAEGVAAIRNPIELVFSPDSRDLYVGAKGESAENSGAVVVFSRVASGPQPSQVPVSTLPWLVVLTSLCALTGARTATRQFKNRG